MVFLRTLRETVCFCCIQYMCQSHRPVFIVEYPPLVKGRGRVSVAVSVKRDRKRDLASDEVCQRRVSDRIGRDERGGGGQMEARIALRY